MSRTLDLSLSTDRLPGGRSSTDPRPHPTTRRAARLTLAGLALSAPFLLGACSTQWSSMSPSVKTVHKSTVTTQRVQPAAIEPASSKISKTKPNTSTGDLDQGSLVHQVATDGHLLVIHYWTDGQLSTEAGAPVVHLSAALKGADRKHAVKVTRFAASLETTGGSTQLADDRGEFVLTPPYSYTTALAVPAGTGTRTLAISFDLLVETAPGSGSYFRQTVLDQVVLSRATPATATAAPAAAAASAAEGVTP
jgi:hypothetical protein